MRTQRQKDRCKEGEPIEFEKEVYLHLYCNETLRKAKLEKLISDVKDIMQTISETHTRCT